MLVSLLVGILIVQFFCNLVAKPSQVTGTPYPVICRASFGVKGANIPAIIRGLIAVAWYGIQTYLASSAFMIVALRFYPELKPYADVAQFGFAGLSRPRLGGLHGPLGDPGPRVSGAAWRRSANSSIGPAPPSTS